MPGTAFFSLFFDFTFYVSTRGIQTYISVCRCRIRVTSSVGAYRPLDSMQGQGPVTVLVHGDCPKDPHAVLDTPRSAEARCSGPHEYVNEELGYYTPLARRKLAR